MGETCNPRKEDETKVLILAFQYGIELLERPTDIVIFLLISNRVQEWFVVLIDKDDDLLSRLFVGTFDNTFEAIAYVYFPFVLPINVFPLR